MNIENIVHFVNNNLRKTRREIDDEDEEQLLLQVFPTFENRNCIKNFLEVVVPMYSDREFKMHFRVKKLLFESIVERFECSDNYSSLRADKRCSAKKHVAVFLWFAGHEGCCFRDLADRFDLSLSSVSLIIARTTMFLSSLAPKMIKWPNESEMEESCKFFCRKSGFRNAIGCIDGTHVVIDPPAQSKDDYIDRKGNTSVCLQAVCNEKKKFTNVYVGFPGSSHDSWVFQNSNISEKLNSICGDYYILGDSAYPCKTNLITPYKDNGHLTNAQKNFNVKLSSSRVIIEHSFGILKQRFRQLYHCKLRGIDKICHFIRACCVLHNIADEEDLDFSLEIASNANEEYVQYGEMAKGNSKRDAICAEIHEQQTK